MMNKERLNQLLDAYGADQNRWPAAERAAAAVMLAGDASFGVARREAAALDRVLGFAPAGTVSDELLARILESAPRPHAPGHAKARVRGRSKGFSLPWMLGLDGGFGTLSARPAAIIALALVVGLGLGTLVPVMQTAKAPTDSDLLNRMWGSPAITQDGANW